VTSDLTKQPVKKSLIAMAAPASIGMLMTFLFQLVDTYFVGKLGSHELAAISFSFPVYILVIGLFMGIASGVSSTVGKALGEQQFEKAKSATTISIITFMLITIGLGYFGYHNITLLFSQLGAQGNMLVLISDYMQLLYLGMFLLVGGLIGNSALMAKGVMARSTLVMGIGGVVNLVLDYLLIFGMGPIPAMALQGAALATVISWFLIFILMTILAARENLISFSGLKSFKQAGLSLLEISRIAIPAVAAQVLNPVAIAVITRLVSQHGHEAVAAYGIAARLESLGLTGILALSVILTPFSAQNFGAGRQDRLDQVVAYSGRMTVYWGLLLFIVMLLSAEMLGAIFSDDAAVIRQVRYYFYIVGISFPAFGLALISTSIFNGVYQPFDSLKITLVKSLVLTIPLTLLGSIISLEGVWIGLAIANILGAVYAGRLINRWLAEKNSRLHGHNPLLDYWSDLKHLLSLFKR